MAKLYFYYSTMNAGKSTTLLQSSYNYRERDMNTVVYTAAIDDRFGVGKVTSRIGISQDAFLFRSETNLFDEINEHLKKEKVHCVLVDEAQFLSKQQVYQLSDVVDKLKIPVLCYIRNLLITYNTILLFSFDSVGPFVLPRDCGGGVGCLGSEA